MKNIKESQNIIGYASGIHAGEPIIRIPKGSTIFRGDPPMDYKLHKCKGTPAYKKIVGELLYNRIHFPLLYCMTCGQYFTYTNSKRMAKKNAKYYNFIKIKPQDLILAEKAQRAANKSKTNKKKKTKQKTTYDNKKKEDSIVWNVQAISEDDKTIEIKDFLIRTDIHQCAAKGHIIEDIRAVVKIMNRRGVIETISFPAIYCKECNKYYILESVYKRILRKGVPICKVITLKTFIKMQSGEMNMNKESLLYSLGYNVNARIGLTSKQRRKILELVIKKKIMSKAEVMSHLDMLIRRSMHSTRLDNARLKWEEDRAYVSNLSIERRTVEVRSITQKNKV